MSKIAKTLQPPYYAVIFTSERTEVENGYGRASEMMVELASKQPGVLGVERVRGEDGFGITVSYWESLEAIQNWRENMQHRAVQERGKQEWYQRFMTRVCKVERDSFFQM